MITYDKEKLKEIIAEVIRDNIDAASWMWLNEERHVATKVALAAAFVLMPRKTGKEIIAITRRQQELMKPIRSGFAIDYWTADKLSRGWLLLKYDSIDQDRYFQAIENLFSVAEMNEQVALYAALPVLPYPQLWLKRCMEGIRSNIGTVLEVIMYDNPYPAENLEEPAWNQMILKAFFTEKQVNRIQGLEKRANEELASILIDYAMERHSAGRTVDPMLWHLVGKFVTSMRLNDMKQGKFKE